MLTKIKRNKKGIIKARILELVKTERYSIPEIKDIDIAVNAIDGYIGLQSTINIIKSGINLALSNKESIVQAGHIVMKLAKQNKVKIFPVDSEHSALWQCMEGEKKSNIKKLILTGSGKIIINQKLQINL